MHKPVDQVSVPSSGRQWLPDKLFVQLHQELTLLASRHIARRDIAADLASQCLMDWWETSSSRAAPHTLKATLRNRLSELIAQVQEDTKRQRTAEAGYLLLHNENAAASASLIERRSRLSHAISLLEPLQRQVLLLLTEEELSFEQIARRLHCPLRTVKRLYKYAVFRLRKETGQWKRYP